MLAGAEAGLGQRLGWGWGNCWGSIFHLHPVYWFCYSDLKQLQLNFSYPNPLGPGGVQITEMFG